MLGIVGVGPVGGILAAHLAKHNDIVLVDILKDHLNEIKNRGLKISGVADMEVKIEKICYSIAELGPYDVDIVFIAVKASVLPGVVNELKKVYSKPPLPKFVSVQNGLDTEKVIAEAFGEENALRVVVNYAGNLIANGSIKMTFFHPPNYIGSLSPKSHNDAKKIADMITKAGLETEFAEDIQRYVWQKVILNSALMPISAITGMTMKQVMDFQGTREMVEEALRECIAVSKGAGYDMGEGFYDKSISYLEKAGHHKPSMVADLEGGRPTEIGFLNGKIVHYGKKHKIPTPYNKALTNLVEALELMRKGG